jgi:hypothetical protein
MSWRDWPHLIIGWGMVSLVAIAIIVNLSLLKIRLARLYLHSAD